VHHYKDGSGNELGLVHRDVSPENILIDRFGRTKVADFGITKAVKRSGTERTNPGKLMYCSPEQLEGKALDLRSDIYCVGLLMYFLFTDTDRFAAEIAGKQPREQVRGRMKQSPLPDLQHVHPRLAHICTVCMREAPGERYQTCEDLGTDVDIFFKDSQKVVTNDVLEEFLSDLFSPSPNFVSRRYISLSGTPHLDQPGFVPARTAGAPTPAARIATVRMDADTPA
jgi:serine/threonine-protein kinase